MRIQLLYSIAMALTHMLPNTYFASATGPVKNQLTKLATTTIGTIDVFISLSCSPYFRRLYFALVAAWTREASIESPTMP